MATALARTKTNKNNSDFGKPCAAENVASASSREFEKKLFHDIRMNTAKHDLAAKPFMKVL